MEGHCHCVCVWGGGGTCSDLIIHTGRMSSFLCCHGSVTPLLSLQSKHLLAAALMFTISNTESLKLHINAGPLTPQPYMFSLLNTCDHQSVNAPCEDLYIKVVRINHNVNTFLAVYVYYYNLYIFRIDYYSCCFYICCFNALYNTERSD